MSSNADIKDITYFLATELNGINLILISSSVEPCGLGTIVLAR
jgi:hypothetical protein